MTFVHKATIEKTRKITIFIYHHSLVMSLMRSFTGRKELMRPDITSFATNYLTLRSIQDSNSKNYVPQEWKVNNFYRKGDAVNVKYTVHDVDL